MTVYIVQELHWEWNDEAFVLERDTPIKAFESRQDAEAYRIKLEAKARREWTGGKSTYYGEHGSGKEVEAFYEVIAMELEP